MGRLKCIVSAMRRLIADPYILFFLWFLLVNINPGDHYLRVEAQTNEPLHQAMDVRDQVAFFTYGGDMFTYRNYYKWSYAKWRNSPDRIRLEKILFWKSGFLWDASNPPEEYEYSSPFYGEDQTVHGSAKE